VKEKKMFGSLAFMVNGKMCLTAGPDRMMCRIDPEKHDEAIAKKGARTVIMKGRKYKGYVHVDEDNLRTKTAFAWWTKLALDFNAKMKKQ